MKPLCWILLTLLPQLSQAHDAFPVNLPECQARLEHRTVEPNLVMVRSDCPLSLPSLATVLEKGLQGLFPGNELGIRTVFLGRLMNYPNWSKALAHAAARSSNWDARLGRPSKRGENDNYQVTQLLNDQAYPQELQPVFARYGLKPCIAGVEKVLIFKAKDIFVDNAQASRHISANARLPADAQVWLTLKPIASDCAHR